MKKNYRDFYITVVGVILLVVGLFLVKTLAEPQGILKALPYVLVGIGCGTFGHGMGNIIRQKAMIGNPNIQKQIEIDTNDERNIAIGNRAKAKAYDMMEFVLGALLISFALMGVDIIAVLLLVFAYLFVNGYCIYYRSKYDKVM